MIFGAIVKCGELPDCTVFAAPISLTQVGEA